MIRVTLQSALCLCLSPLLIAQQATQAAPPQAGGAKSESRGPTASLSALPPNAKITLLAPQSFAQTLPVGSSVQLTVVHDVVVNGVTVLPAGTHFSAILTDSKSGSVAINRHGEIRIRGRDLASVQLLRIRIPASTYRARSRGEFPWRTALLVVAIALPCLALMSGDR